MNNYLKNFNYFYKHLKNKIIHSIFLSILVGLFDGLGLSMFLPLLQLSESGGALNNENLGKMKVVIDFMGSLGIPLTTSTFLIIIALFFLTKGIFKFWSLYYNVILQQIFICKIRLTSLQALNEVSFKYFVTSDVGRIQNTLTGEVGRVVTAYTGYFRSMEQFLLLVVYMIFAFFIDPKFAILVSVGGLTTNFLYKRIYVKTKAASKKITDDSHIFQGLLIQHVALFKYLKSTGFLLSFGKRIKSVILTIENNNKKVGYYSAILNSAREPLLIMVVCLVIFIQITFLKGNLGAILISLIFFYRALSSLISMQNSWNYFMGVSGSLENMTTFNQELSAQKELDGENNFTQFKREIQIKDGCLSFDEQRPVLNQIQLSILKNETIAFVGESGSGKSTLVNVIAGLLPLDKGSIMIDQVDLSTVNKESYQKRIGFVAQEPVIFNDTIYNNITLWQPSNPENTIHFNNVTKQAAIAQFVESLPDKEHELLGNNGINLSGGQKQRMSIARELYKDIDLLILDEATSALDSETEKEIQENIDQLKGKYTILIVAHRLSTVKNADKIVFMENGHIKNVAPFDELIFLEPRFKRMVELQEL